MASERFRLRPGRPAVAVVAALLGAGLVMSALLEAPLPGPTVATGTTGILLGGAVVAMALIYLLSPAWRAEVITSDEALEVVTRRGRGLRLPWTEIVRLVVVPARASAYLDGGSPRKSFLLPGAGARAPYRIADQRRLYDIVRAHVPDERVVEVRRLKASELPRAASTPAEPPPP